MRIAESDAGADCGDLFARKRPLAALARGVLREQLAGKGADASCPLTARVAFAGAPELDGNLGWRAGSRSVRIYGKQRLEGDLRIKRDRNALVASLWLSVTLAHRHVKGTRQPCRKPGRARAAGG